MAQFVPHCPFLASSNCQANFLDSPNVLFRRLRACELTDIVDDTQETLLDSSEAR